VSVSVCVRGGTGEGAAGGAGVAEEWQSNGFV